jgi:sugar transferase (PEP-CTERM/EpsH1 system associated)
MNAMSNLLYLVHRLPYPPNKGDKIRSYHLLKHLVERHQVFLGTFIDDPQDETHVDTLRSMCAGLHVVRLETWVARMRSVTALWNGAPMSLPYYCDAGLKRWVERTASEHQLDAIIVFSSSMAQYADALPDLPLLVDFVDVDSAKWSDYATAHRWPLGWLYEREARQLLRYERSVAVRAQRSFFVTEQETELFRRLAPECSSCVEPMGNGVDAEYFSPDPMRASPFEAGQSTLVFTGAMDYWPNIDAVSWFVREIWPLLQVTWPRLHLHIVGRNPGAAVQALASSKVRVTGNVPDVRPYLQHAAIVVAPLRLARGIQNKVLEAMAMGRPVVASEACASAIHARLGVELMAASLAADFAGQIDALLSAPDRAAAIGRAGRQRVVNDYSWTTNMSRIDRHLEASHPCEAMA